MKKVSILIAAILVSFASFAQEAGRIGVEINFDPLGAFSNQNSTFSVDGLKARYFISEDVVIRGTINFSSNPSKREVYDVANDKLESTTKSSNTYFGITPGFEYHLAKFEKGSIYAGAEIGLGRRSVKSSTEYTDNNSANTESKTPSTTFNVAAFTGFDYYITSNLYLGTELSFGYRSTKAKGGSTTVGGKETTDNGFNKTSAIGVNCVPSFRLGWTF